MLSPKRTKFRKQQKGKNRGLASARRTCRLRRFRRCRPSSRGSRHLASDRGGSYGDPRATKRAGKLWIRVFPDKPRHQEAARDRMGQR